MPWAISSRLVPAATFRAVPSGSVIVIMWASCASIFDFIPKKEKRGQPRVRFLVGANGIEPLTSSV